MRDLAGVRDTFSADLARALWDGPLPSALVRWERCNGTLSGCDIQIYESNGNHGYVCAALVLGIVVPGSTAGPADRPAVSSLIR